MKRLTTNSILIHHSVTPQEWGKAQTVNNIASSHIKRGLNAPGGDISYHFLIGKDWTYQCRPLNTVGYHAGKWAANLTSVAICIVGNFNDDKPTEYQQKELARLVGEMRGHFGKLTIKLHREIKLTACPGGNITHGLIQSILTKYGNMKDMDKVQLLHEEIRKLNTEIGRVTKERDSYKEALDSSRTKEKEYYENWQRNIDERKKYQAMVEAMQGSTSKLKAILKILTA